MKAREYIDMSVDKKQACFLTEGASQSLSRVLAHTKTKTGFGIVTPFRKEASQKKNFELLSKAEVIARDAKFGFFKIRGYWYEENPDTKEKKQVEEISLFIPNYGGEDLLDVLKKISNLSDPRQDGFIYSHDGKMELWGKKGDDYNIITEFSKITPSNVEEMLKKIKDGKLVGGSAARDRGREKLSTTSGFYFESFWVTPGNSIGAMVFTEQGYIC